MTAQNPTQIIKQILNCEIKDENGLNDFQKLVSNQGIFIPQVGINRFRLPILLDYKGQQRHHDAKAAMSISLEKDKTGVNMSRLCVILQRETEKHPLSFKLLQQVLQCYSTELKDSASDAPILQSSIKISFHYAYKQPSLVSNNWGWQYYPVTLEARKNRDHYKFFLSLEYEYSSTCPCSLSMAKQYEQEFAQGKISVGDGIASAHSQRSLLQCKVEVQDTKNFFIEELLHIVRQAIPTETQSLVKREDEQAFAILNGSNPMFVEHVCRRIHDALENEQQISDWICHIEHFESLHSHNAAATIYKNIPGGLHHSTIFS